MIRALAGLAFLGAAVAASRGRSESFGLGTIPPPPAHDNEEFCRWARRTFGLTLDSGYDEPVLRGTLVRSRKPLLAKEYGQWNAVPITLPSGTLMTVIDIDCTAVVRLYLAAKIHVPLFTSSKVVQYAVEEVILKHDDVPFDILDDNWGPLVVPSKGRTQSPQRGWHKQLRLSKRYGRP